MDPLSSLRMLPGAAFAAASAASGNTAPAPAPSPIPAAELQALQLNPVGSDAAPAAVGATQSSGGFQSLLGDFVSDVNNRQAAASSAVTGLLGGKNVSLHQAMISMEEASVSFQMMVEVRNNLLNSYQELMRMQV